MTNSINNYAFIFDFKKNPVIPCSQTVFRGKICKSFNISHYGRTNSIEAATTQSAIAAWLKLILLALAKLDFKYVNNATMSPLFKVNLQYAWGVVPVSTQFGAD